MLIPSDERWTVELPRAWRVATLDRSHIEIVKTNPDIRVYLLDGDGVSVANVGNPWIGVYRTNYGQPLTAGVFVHEIGHFLGCCRGEGTKNGHFVTGESGIMSNPRCAECLLFSDRELREMRIGAKD